LIYVSEYKYSIMSVMKSQVSTCQRFLNNKENVEFNNVDGIDGEQKCKHGKRTRRHGSHLE